MKLSNLFGLFVFPAACLAANLQLRIPPSEFLPNPSALPSSTTASLMTQGKAYTAFLNRRNIFEFYGVAPGSYVLEVHCRDYAIAPLRIDVSSNDHSVKAWQTFRGNEWGNRGEMVESASTGSTPIDVRVLGQKNYYETRPKFSPLSLFKNPMILLALVAMGFMFGMPYLMDNMDPELRAEFEEQQKRGGLTAGAVGANPLQNFDMAAWMAGSSQNTDTGDSKDRDRADRGTVRRR